MSEGQRPFVLLLNPRMCSRRSARLPLSLLALASVLEGRYRYRILDGNVLDDLPEAALGCLAQEPRAVAAVTVMPGPQVPTAIEVSARIRSARPDVPIVWGGYFPTLYPGAAVNAPYVDLAVRGQGEDTLLDVLARVENAPRDRRGAVDWAGDGLGDVAGLSGMVEGTVVHAPVREFRAPDELPAYPYEALDRIDQYLARTFMGQRTAVHQVAIGCRYRCTFCGVVSMFNGLTRPGAAARLHDTLVRLRDRYGATAVQFYDHNFFDREEIATPVIDVLAEIAMPWWCYARTDTLAGFPARTWERLRQSHLRMAYLGAESGSDAALRRMKKGATTGHTLEVAARCREYGVIPEFSFILGGPEDPEAETDQTLRFVRTVKQVNPQSEIILYFYSPTPQRSRAHGDRRVEPLATLDRYGPDGPDLPSTPEEWTEPRWMAYVCHQDAPWLSPRLRQRVADFAQVLGCRFPTVQDHRSPRWGKALLRALASWRYATGTYAHPVELRWARRFVTLKEPAAEGL
jgi:radical SAM superfamily enzyme YgiQ (UPF0313 family)